MFKMPSQSFWHQSTNLYHHHGEVFENPEDQVLNCSQTKQAHLTLKDAIKGDTNRQIEYHLLVFEEGIKLVNHTFSGDATFVDCKYNTMEAVVSHEGQEVDIDGNSNFWVIAVEGGSRLATLATSKKHLPRRARKPTANP